TVVTSHPVTVAAGTQARGSVQCPGQKVPLGGGAFVNGSDLSIGLASSFPSGRGWVVDVGNPTAAATSFRVRVLCARAPKLYTLSVGAFAPLPVGRSASAFAACPAGSLPLGGGPDTSSNQPLADLTASFPSNQAWGVAELNGGIFDAAV